MAPDSNTWKPPVLFHFSVEFQWMLARASASFAEVDGLGQELVLESNAARSGEAPGYPKGVKVGDIVLKRALEPLSDLITIWVQCCFNFTEIGWISAGSVFCLAGGTGAVPVQRNAGGAAVDLSQHLAPL